MPNTTPKIGKDVIESLTLSMYEDCRFIYREYIQNAADAIDKAVKSSILEKGTDEIHVRIDPEQRSISIVDNATGISKDNVVSILLNIAHSTKKRGEDKGFRGIGRLGGLGYCSKLIFETSYYGEDVKSIMTWDAELLKYIINDREHKEEAVNVLKDVTNVEYKKEDKDAHYFRVIMEDVTSDDLLDVKAVVEYLSMVAPVDISSQFIYRSKINEFKKVNGFEVDTYNIYINGDQIYKPYTSVIYEDNNGGKKKVDDILDVEFIISKDDNGNPIYWGWYTISCLKGQMKPKNIARGIRLRKENIQIGDEEICKKFFSRTDDQRFSFYYFGEIHAISKSLIPNSRRDYFNESKECTDFEIRIKQDFLKLKELCYDAQRYRSSIATIQKGQDLRDKIEEKENSGYTSPEERTELQNRLNDHKKKEEQAQKQLSNVTKKIKDSGSPLKNVIDKFNPPTKNNTTFKAKETNTSSSPENQGQRKTTYRTDNPIYSIYTKKEKKLIGKIYDTIRNLISDEDLQNTLISRIEKEITQ